MKINRINQRESEVTFETGTRDYLLDRQPTAAQVVTNFQTTAACTKRPLSEEDQRLVSIWFGSQPQVIHYITDQQLHHILDNEDKRKNVKFPEN